MKLPQGLTQKIGRSILTMKKDSPRLLFVAGIVGVVGSTILACRATMKLEETIDEFKNEVDQIKQKEPLGHNERSYNREMTYAYVTGTGRLLRLYAPAIILGGAAIGALATSHITLTRRNAGLTAAYSAISASFDAYRERVRKELGEEKERDIYQLALEDKLALVDHETGLFVDPNKYSPYARFFDEYNRNWEKTPEFNRLFIQCQQNYANQLLHARGHIFLNEVYDSLGIPRSPAGQVVGWVMDQGGDNYVDFGIFKPSNASFVNGVERSILLDFNVDGAVMDKI